MMPEMESVGRMLLLLGGVLILLGLLILLGRRVPFLGKLPGDIHIEREGFSCSVPLASSAVLSILLTVILNLVLRILRK